MRFQWSLRLVTVFIVISFSSVETQMQYFIDPLAINSVRSVVGAGCLCFDSWKILLLVARCTENLPFGAFLVLESLPGEVFLYPQCGVQSTLRAVTETDFLLWWSCPSMRHKDLGVEVQLHQFFITSLYGGELLASYSGWFSPKKCTPSILICKEA